MRIYSMICAVLIVAGTACASSQAEEVRDARIAQIDEQTVSKTRVIEDRQASREQAIETRAELAEEEIEEVAGESGDSEDMVAIQEDRAAYESDVRARWETIGVRINAAHKKMDTLGQNPPPKLSTELNTLAKEHKELKDDVLSVPKIPPTNWEKATDTLDERLGELNERVKDLTDTIEDS